MPANLSNTAKRAKGQGSRAGNLSRKGKGPTTLSNTAKRSTAKGSPKSPAKFGKLGQNTLKANKAKVGGKGGGSY